MKTILLFLIILNALHCSAQVINVYHKGSTSQHKVSATSDQGIFTETGLIRNEQIDSVQIIQEGPFSRAVLEMFGKKKKGMQMFSKVDSGGETFEYKADYVKFSSQRSMGKIFQLLGVAALGAVSYMTIQNNVHAKKGDFAAMKEIPAALPLAGLSVVSLGIIIDIDAARHLMRKKRD